ncbi:acetyltransferase, GNAT family protein [Streptococcus pneumoniae]|nr:acetyltransferase, GNAT family protein [Streptococcus pneumoniae]
MEEGELLAYAAVTKSPEEAYEAIYEGNWQAGESEYLVFHRIAVATDAENKVMQHIFEKLGFKQVGKVPVDGERLAYQKLKK